jgi:hypothetical protein
VIPTLSSDRERPRVAGLGPEAGIHERRLPGDLIGACCSQAIRAYERRAEQQP